MINHDIFLNKRQSLRACLARIRDKYTAGRETLQDLDRQEIILLNLQRACEIVIDLAMHVVASEALGIPQDSRNAFALLHEAGWIDQSLSEKMQNMVGFRNIAIHQYQDLNLAILEAILNHHLTDFEAFAEALRARL